MKHNRTHCSGSTSTDIFSAHPDPELLTELRQTMSTINTVFNHFEEVVDPTLIDCYIYELNAAQLRYQFLLRRFKSPMGQRMAQTGTFPPIPAWTN